MYKRIILKLSGETLAPDASKPDAPRGVFDAQRVDAAAEMILKLQARGIQVGVVIGGGNIWRGRFTKEMNGANADQMGMLATIINALCVQDAITRKGGRAVVFSAQEMNRFTRLYTRSAELDADAIFKGTTVEGVYDSDPRTNPNAKLLKDVSYAEAVEKRLHVMDITAFVLCQEQHVPEIRVFSMENLDNILKVADGEPIGTRVHE